ncbi:MAG: hypothetical protein ACM35H_13615 [Bacteroidota bacterium]|nr:hypothetical protein [Kiloniellaceae bacterium]
MAIGGNLFPVLKNELRAVRSALWLRPAVYCLAAAAASEAERALDFGQEKLTLEVDRAALRALGQRLRQDADTRPDASVGR